jgi:flavin-dependent dehydrogenase
LVLENMRVVGHRQEGEKHVIELDNGNQILSKFAFGSFGRNKPGFLRETENRQGRSYTGVKMHLAHDDFPRDQIELHHFPGGYAGMSAIEDGHYCFAYLVDDEVVRTCRGNLDQVEIQFLQKNPHLKKRLLEGRSVWGRTTTSGVHFRPRPLSDSGLLFLGDTAGMIPPLAGNGMSMALHSAVLACNLLSQTRSGLSKNDLIKAYTRDWNASFSKRLQQARRLQTIMEQPGMTAFTLQIFRLFPGLFRLAAKGTHGVEIPLPKG